MAARFRIRTSQGQEISFASHAMFAEFVRSGELSPDDVVFDAETKEWSSALTHPVVLQIESEAEEAEEAEEEVAAPAAQSSEEASDDLTGEDVAPDAPSSADIGLELAPAPDALSPEEESAAFVKRMEAERASELDFDEEGGFEGFKMEQGSSGLVDGFSLVEEEQEARPEPTRPSKAPERREAGREAPREEGEPRWAREPEPPPKKKKKKGSGALRRYAPLVIVGAVVAAAGVYFGPELLAPTTGDGTEPAGDSVALPPPPAPLIPDTEEALRERAQERFLTTTRALLRDLPPIPDVWLDGQYLATPSDYPQVREAWNGVLTLVRQIRAGDNERYRAGYSRALDDARVEGSSRTLRLAGAVGDFQGRVAPRAAHYDRVEALATAALRGHDALVEAEGTIAYEPASGTPVSGDPVIQAVGRNPDAQALLDEVLDMILAELNEPNGPGSAQNLGEWIWDGILGAVTS
jgi:hypothetical protein